MGFRHGRLTIERLSRSVFASALSSTSRAPGHASRAPQRVQLSVLVLAFLLTTFATACDSTPAPVTPAAARPLPAYSGHVTELFDDVIESRAVGLDLEQIASPRSDPRLRERAQLADAVLRARVSTVTGRVDGPNASYRIGFTVIQSLAGKYASEITAGGSEFTATFDRTSPSIGVLRSLEGRLVGKTLIVFVRAFLRPDGDHELHVHAAADNKDVSDAVASAVALEEVGGVPPSSSPAQGK